MPSVAVAVHVWGRGGHTAALGQQARPETGGWSAQGCSTGPRTGISPPRDKVHKIPKDRP